MWIPPISFDSGRETGEASNESRAYSRLRELSNVARPPASGAILYTGRTATFGVRRFIDAFILFGTGNDRATAPGRWKSGDKSPHSKGQRPRSWAREVKRNISFRPVRGITRIIHGPAIWRQRVGLKPDAQAKVSRGICFACASGFNQAMNNPG